MASPSSTPVYVIDADYHESGRLHHAVMVRLYHPQGVASRVLTSADNAESEQNALTALSGTFSAFVQRTAAWNSRGKVFAGLTQRFLAMATPFPWYYRDRFGPRYRYSDSENLDLYDFFTEYGAVKMDLVDAMRALDYVLPREAFDSACTRAFASALLCLRADYVSGLADALMFTDSMERIRTGIRRNLYELVSGTSADAFGVEVTPDWREYVLPAYQDIGAAFGYPV